MKTFFNNDLTACRGGMLKDYYLRRYHAADRERLQQLRSLKNRAAAEQHMLELRSRLSRSFGPLPPPVPSEIRITGQIKTGDLLIDKVLYQSRPGFLISALFYRRKDLPGPMPGVLILCGHDSEGKGCYQKFCQRLALNGFCVLIPDPFGQGERSLPNLSPCEAHDYFGCRLGLLGEFFGTWRLHDALVSLEYLKSRPETDLSHLGVTGCSGGGTLTSYVNAFSEDVTMAAPVCSITRMSSNLENEIAADCEQNPPGFRALLLDEGDFFLARAPRPVMFGIQNNDFFCPQGTRKLYREVQNFYRLFGAEDRLELAEGQGNHGYPDFHQFRTIRFFARLSGLPFQNHDGELNLIRIEETFCTPDGSVWKMPEAVSPVDMLGEIHRQQTHLPPDCLPSFWKKRLLTRPPKAPAFCNGFQQYMAPAGLHASRYLLNTEPGITVALKKISAATENHLTCSQECRLFIPQCRDGAAEFLKWKKTPPLPCFILEPRGIGESLPCPPECDLYTIYPRLFAAAAHMLGENLAAGQVRDILGAILLLKKHGLKKLTLHAEGPMCIPAALTALLSPVKTRVELRHPPASWKDYLKNCDSELPAELLPFGILTQTDLPELYAAVRRN